MTTAKKIAVVAGVPALARFFGAFYFSMEKGEEQGRKLREELRSGKTDFHEDAALFAVAQAMKLDGLKPSSSRRLELCRKALGFRPGVQSMNGTTSFDQLSEISPGPGEEGVIAIPKCS